MQAKNYEVPRQEEFGVENAGYLGDFSGVFNGLLVSQMKSYRSSVNNPDLQTCTLYTSHPARGGVVSSPVVD
jgi:hypothetical protein